MPKYQISRILRSLTVIKQTSFSITSAAINGGNNSKSNGNSNSRSIRGRGVSSRIESSFGFKDSIQAASVRGKGKKNFYERGEVFKHAAAENFDHIIDTLHKIPVSDKFSRVRLVDLTINAIFKSGGKVSSVSNLICSLVSQGFMRSESDADKFVFTILEKMYHSSSFPSKDLCKVIDLMVKCDINPPLSIVNKIARRLNQEDDLYSLIKLIVLFGKSRCINSQLNSKV